jgi:hypothetical protein
MRKYKGHNKHKESGFNASPLLALLPQCVIPQASFPKRMKQSKTFQSKKQPFERMQMTYSINGRDDTFV